MRLQRWRLVCLVLLVLLAGCTVSLKQLKPYHPVGPRVLQQPGRVALSVKATQDHFVFDRAIAMDDVVAYVRTGLSSELRNAGLEVVAPGTDGATEVDVDIEQMDMGYELFYWWYGVGYSSSKTLATVQLNVAVEVPGSGRRYLRRFAKYEDTGAIKLWVYFIPIPFQTMTESSELMLRAAQKAFSEVASGVARIHAEELGG